MSSAGSDTKNIKEDKGEVLDIFSDLRYVRRACDLISESLQKDCDVLHLENGDIIITAMKPVTFHYSWNHERGKLERVNSHCKNSRRSSNISEAEDLEENGSFDSADEMESV